MKYVFAQLYCLIIAVGIGGIAPVASGVTVDYEVPFFTLPEAPGGVYRDLMGSEWEAITISDFGGTYPTHANAMRYNSSTGRWVRTDSTRSQEFPALGTFERIGGLPTLTNAAGTDGQSFPAISFIAPTDGTYSLQGTGLVSGSSTRVHVQSWTGPDQAASLLADHFLSNATVTDAQVDFSAMPTFQNLSLNQGDRLSIHFYTVTSSGGPSGALKFGDTDPVRISGPQLESVTLHSGQPGFGKQWLRENPFTIAGHPPGFTFGAAGAETYWNTNHTFIDSNGSDAQYDQWAAAYGKPALREVDRSGDLVWDQAFADAVQSHVDNIENLRGLYLRDEIPPGQVDGAAQIAAGIRTVTTEHLVWGNLAGGHVIDNSFMVEWMSKVNPDILQYDFYPFRIEGRDIDRYFERLMAVRNHALNAGIPYWAFLQSFGDESDNRMLSESEMRMNAFSHLAAGYTGLHYYTHAPQLGDDFGLLYPDGTPTPMYSIAQAMNAEIQVVGQSLKYLSSAGVRFIPGSGVATPTGLTDWSSFQPIDPLVLDIEIDGVGGEKSGLIGFFTDDDGKKYIMLTNLNHGPSDTATAAALDFTVTFDTSVDSLWRLNRQSGIVEELVLNNHVLNLRLPGGTGDLFGYSPLFPGFDPEVLLADYDNSGQVGQGDLALVLQYWGTAVSGGESLDPLWINTVGVTAPLIGQDELALVLQHWGNVVALAGELGNITAATGLTEKQVLGLVPEPASGVVLVTAILFLMRRVPTKSNPLVCKPQTMSSL